MNHITLWSLQAATPKSETNLISNGQNPMYQRLLQLHFVFIQVHLILIWISENNNFGSSQHPMKIFQKEIR